MNERRKEGRIGENDEGNQKKNCLRRKMTNVNKIEKTRQRKDKELRKTKKKMRKLKN